MATGRKTIPLHRLKEYTDQGFQVEKVHISNRAAQEAVLMDTHRDDHYIFLIQEAGKSRCMVDFHSFTLRQRTVFFILPGQVHRYLHSDIATEGWFVALDAGLVPGMLRVVLEDPLLEKKPLVVGDADLQPLVQCLELVHGVSRRQPAGHFSKQVINGLLTSFVAMVSAVYSQHPMIDPGPVPRPRMITQEFRKLLGRQYKELKSPAKYAAALNLSLSYLNEVVKATTGFAVSYWIQQEIVLEAKRLLYHSDCTVKEIAYELGYEDHAYFSRLFSKMTGHTPGEFRRIYRE